MSKSLKRVKAQAEELGLSINVIELQVSTKTAQQAADAIGVDINQIAKSIIFRGATSGRALLFLTAGGNRVDTAAAAQIADEDLERADAEFIRAETGFAIGGVSPLGHINPTRSFFDPTLTQFDTIWAAAGTPNHMFELRPQILADAIGADIEDFAVLPKS